MHIGQFEFAPPLLPTVAYFVVLGFLLFLGGWQLERAGQKHAELAQRAEAVESPVMDLNEMKTTLERDEFRRVTAKGTYDVQRQFLLDNQVEDRVVGYRWLVPFKLAGRDQSILVDRGFVPLGESRDELPELLIEEPEQTVTGLIGRGPGVGIRLGEATDNPGQWPRRMQYLDYDYLQSQIPYPIPDYLVIEGSLDLAPRIERAGRDAWRFGPERHEGYAFQWFSMALALTVIWIVVNTKRRKPGDSE